MYCCCISITLWDIFFHETKGIKVWPRVFVNNRNLEMDGDVESLGKGLLIWFKVINSWTQMFLSLDKSLINDRHHANKTRKYTGTSFSYLYRLPVCIFASLSQVFESIWESIYNLLGTRVWFLWSLRPSDAPSRIN